MTKIMSNTETKKKTSSKKGTIKVPKNMTVKTQYAPYGYAMDSEGKAISLPLKLFYLLKILVSTGFLLICSKFSSGILPQTGFFSYIYLIKQADLVFLMGGGYLVTKHTVKDFFGIILNSIPLYVAKFYKKKIIILPISFGPFASPIHEKIIGRAIKDSILFCRDKISLSFAKKHNPKARYLPDLALYEWTSYE
jgi:polysaccharide pyruvyl transferase WcaK-like protein